MERNRNPSEKKPEKKKKKEYQKPQIDSQEYIERKALACEKNVNNPISPNCDTNVPPQFIS